MSVKLIVGLGNPGLDMTRHNLGRMVVQALAERQRALFRNHKAFKALITSLSHSEKKVFLALPETYMNQSGEAVHAICHYYGIEPEETVVVVDEMAFELGDLRLQLRGGPGGHNGLADIERLIGPNYKRLRLGIGKAPGKYEDHVLGRFTLEEQRMLPIEKAVDAIDRLTREDFARVATELNTKKGIV